MGVNHWTERVELENVYVRHVFVWESDAGGKADIFCDGVQGPLLRGQLDYLVTSPDPVAAPADNYDVTLEGERGYDVLDGAGADRDTTIVERAYVKDIVGNIRVVSLSTTGPLRLKIANAGANKAGRIAIYMVQTAVPQ